MPRSVAVRALILASLVALPLAYGCSGDIGVVPTCAPDVSEAGIQLVDGGCSSFAICLNDAGNRVAAAECCKDSSGKPFTGNELQDCLFGYGAIAAPTSGAGGGATTTTTTSGAGGAGGGP